MVNTGRLRGIELFADLTDSDLGWLATQGSEVVLPDGTVVFEDGEEGEHFYVLLSGELLITKMIDGREHVMGRHQANAKSPGPDGKPRAANQYTGELPMLAGGGYVARGTTVGTTELIVYDRPTFLGILARCPQVCRVLLPTLAWRIRSYERESGRSALLDGLGMLTAGLMHELNNPVAAVVRAARDLAATLAGATDWAVSWCALATPAEHAALTRLTASRSVADELSTDVAAEIAELLTERGVPKPAELASIFADCGVDRQFLESVDVRAEAYPAAVRFLAYSRQAGELAADIVAASERIGSLVDSARTYVNMGRAPRLDVNLAEGLEATLAMHATLLRDIRVIRDYAELPLVPGYPGELNQVWSNLIRNAAEAMRGSGDLRLRTFREGNGAVVEVADNGPGIPSADLPHLFLPLFTTKDIGSGTGLGLYLSHDIVVHRHNGGIEVTSVPGDTRFRVRLPLSGG